MSANQQPDSTASWVSTSSPQVLDDLMFNPFADMSNNEPSTSSSDIHIGMTTSSPPLALDNIIFDPFADLPGELRIANTTKPRDPLGFEYNNFYISRFVMIPSIVMMVITSLLLIYIILKHLRAVLKLYLSVIFYAVAILFFAAQVTAFLLQNWVRVDKLFKSPYIYL